jgi:hypothetical protein
MEIVVIKLYAVVRLRYGWVSHLREAGAGAIAC